MTKSALHTKLTSYSALAVSIVGIHKNANAQVVYTDVIPDTTVTNGFYNLDLNNDGFVDFQLAQVFGTSAYGFNYQAVYIHPEFVSNAIDTANASNLMVHATDSSFTIDASLNWVDSATTTGTFTSVLALDVPALYYDLGNFLGQNGKFLPVKFDVSGNTHYGWVRLNVDSIATSFTVIDYAYESMPNTPIITGHFSGVGISEKPIEEITIYSFNKKISIEFKDALNLESNIKIFNSIGQEIKNVSSFDSKSEILLNHVSSGIYSIQIIRNTKIYTKKLFIH